MAGLSAIGIDLGTTYSSVAIVNEQGGAEIVPNAETERLTPSAVFFDEDAIVVGQTARDNAAMYPDQVVQFVKRQMGNGAWYVSFDGQRLGPADISSLILAKLRRDAELYLNRPIRHAVITVPAYFNDAPRRSTIAAAKQAGLDVLDLLNEPTAAAIAFGVDRSNQPETVLVYDLGGGTFDVTIMNVHGKEITIVATDGVHELGGKDFDDALMRHAVEAFQGEHGFDPTADPSDAGDLRAQAEKAKRELSKRSRTLMMARSSGKVTRVEATRPQFEALIRPRIDTTLGIVRSTLRAASLEPAQIDRVLLIGGSTRLPLVSTVLTEMFGRPPDASVNPDEAVALGAALMAAHKVAEIAPAAVTPAVAEKVGGLQITDVTSHSIGIEAFVPGTGQRINSMLIARNSPIPAEVAKEFVTTIPDQTAIKVTIFQGEFSDPALCNPVGEFTLHGLPPGRAAGRKVRLVVSCGADGVVRVTAVDIETGLETTTDVSYKSDPASTATAPTTGGARGQWQASKPIV